MNNKSDISNREKLRVLLHQKIQMLCDRALEPKGNVAEGDVEVLERLERVIKLIDTSQPSPALPKPIPRWVVMGCALVIALAIVSVLVFTHVQETDIEVDLTLAYISFVTPKDQSLVLTDALNLTDLGVGGLRGVILLGEKEIQRKSIQLSKEPGQSVQISLATLELPPLTEVRLRYMDEPNRYRITLISPMIEELSLVAHSDGEVRLSGGPDLPSQQRDLSFQSLQLIPHRDNVILDLNFSDASKHHFYPQLPVTRISFEHEEGFPVKRWVSTVLDGTLSFESLNGKRRIIRPREVLRFKPVAVASQIRNILLQEDKIVLQFGGKVKDMCVGNRPDTTCRTLMPTRLESLIANRPLGLLWGATGVVFTLIVSVLKRFEVKL